MEILWTHYFKMIERQNLMSWVEFSNCSFQNFSKATARNEFLMKFSTRNQKQDSNIVESNWEKLLKKFSTFQNEQLMNKIAHEDVHTFFKFCMGKNQVQISRASMKFVKNDSHAIREVFERRWLQLFLLFLFTQEFFVLKTCIAR